MKLRLTILKSIIITAIVLVCCTPVLNFKGTAVNPFSVLASALSATGDCSDPAYGSDVYWDFNETTGELVISGNGQMHCGFIFSISLSPFANEQLIKKVVVKDNVTNIADYAFKNCRNLSELVISDSVKLIEQYAFIDCKSLSSVVLPKSLEEIGEGVFSNSGLKKITILNSDCKINESSDTIPSTATICGYSNSTAQTYAESNGNEFIAITPCSSHSFSSWVTNAVATCIEMGYKTRTCSKCDYLETEIIPRTNHSFSDWKLSSGTTCGSSGTKARTCSICSYEETQAFTSAGHEYSTKWTVDKAATCTANGSKSYHCKNCDTKSNVTTIPATGHSYGNWEIVKEESCTTNGTKQKKCINCTSIIQENITALGHIYSSSWTIDQKSTCIKTGSKSHHCINCDAKKDVTKVAKSSHSYKKQLTKATLSNNGKQVSVCTVCDHTTTKNISKIASVKLSKTTYTYDGKVKTPSVIVKDSDGTPLKKDTHYVVTYPNGRKVVGTYSVNITFKGNYSGNKTLKFTIKLGTVTNLQQISNKKGVSITWNSVRGATGYEVYIFDAKTNSYKLLKAFSDNIAQNPKAKGKLTIKVRAYYKNTSGKIYYGDFSGVKTFTAIK